MKDSVQKVLVFVIFLGLVKPNEGSAGELDDCKQPNQIIECGKEATQFYYNTKDRVCLPGCGQNEMNFFSDLKDCENVCMKKRSARRISGASNSQMLSDIEWSSPVGSSYSNFRRRYPLSFCELQRDTGILCPGERRGNYLEQFYYDTAQNRCTQFIYNGCGGNANRFSTIWECTQSCVRKSIQRFK